MGIKIKDSRFCVPVINDAVIAAADATAAAETLESDSGATKITVVMACCWNSTAKKSVSKKIQSLQSIYKLLK